MKRLALLLLLASSVAQAQDAKPTVESLTADNVQLQGQVAYWRARAQTAVKERDEVEDSLGRLNAQLVRQFVAGKPDEAKAKTK